MTDKLSGLLDDLIDPATLAKVKAKRASRKTDLSDLIPKPEPPRLELLSPTAVILYVQENTCSNCGAISEQPYGIVAMHQLVRNDRKTGTNIGIPLISPNEHPELPRERDVFRTQSLVCGLCAETARSIPQPKAIPSEFPSVKPGTQRWLEQFGYATNDSIRELEERIHYNEERERREQSGTELQPINLLAGRIRDEEGE